jgi:hypothetical protein
VECVAAPPDKFVTCHKIAPPGDAIGDGQKTGVTAESRRQDAQRRAAVIGLVNDLVNSFVNNLTPPDTNRAGKWRNSDDFSEKLVTPTSVELKSQASSGRP